MYLASGTDHEDVTAEARLLQVDHYFDGRIFGARDDMSFSKAKLVREIVGNAICEPEELIGFGDGLAILFGKWFVIERGVRQLAGERVEHHFHDMHHRRDLIWCQMI